MDVSSIATAKIKLNSPAIWELHVHMTLQQHSEEVDIIVPRFTPLLQCGLCSGV